MHFYNLVPIFFLSLTPDNCNQINTNDACVNPKKRKRENETKSQNIISHFCTPYMQMIIFLNWGGEKKEK